MRTAIQRFGDRLLSVFVPHTTAAAVPCRYESRCVPCGGGYPPLGQVCKYSCCGNDCDLIGCGACGGCQIH